MSLRMGAVRFEEMIYMDCFTAAKPEESDNPKAFLLLELNPFIYHHCTFALYINVLEISENKTKHAILIVLIVYTTSSLLNS